VHDAQDTEQSNHRGSPPPALICWIAKTGVLVESVLKRDSHGHRLFQITNALQINEIPLSCWDAYRKSIRKLLFYPHQFFLWLNGEVRSQWQQLPDCSVLPGGRGHPYEIRRAC